MSLFWAIAEWGDHRQLFQLIDNPKRCEQLGDIGRVAQTNQLWKLRVKRPNLKLDPLIEEISPQLALDRHQPGLIRFFLQLLAAIRGGSAIQGILPCNG